MIFVATVLHTGTHSLLHGFENYRERSKKREIIHKHFAFGPMNREILAADEIFISYRNPYRVATTWSNRHRLPALRSRREKRNWYEQWEEWGKLVPHAKTQVVSVNDMKLHMSSKMDSHRLHRLVDEENYERFFQCVPEKAINFAMDIVNEVRDHIPGSLKTK